MDRFERLESQVTTLHSGACILPYSPHSNTYASFTIAVKDFVSGRVQKYTPSRKLCVAKYNYDLWAAAVRNWILRYLPPVTPRGSRWARYRRPRRSTKKGPVLILKILVDCHWILCYGKFEPAMRQSGEHATEGD